MKRPEVELVGVDADAPDFRPPWRPGARRGRTARDLEDRLRALLDLTQRGLLALRLVVERRVVRVVREHLDLRVRLLRALDVPADVADDRGDVVRADALMICVPPCSSPRAREVADEEADSCSAKTMPAAFFGLPSKSDVRDVHPGELGFGNLGATAFIAL
jgi:hypothetical protein